uniref:TMV resistance protein N n=1 Tax=Cajanus cajan TaxID=3821 RepID=A0A151SYC4_CAJCA|nr:TMV resistance protein N [Cajanus cajan]
MSMWTYDVFLSFRGEDTRFGFTGHLYSALIQRGIKAFMDDEGLEKGEQISPAIFNAIEESRMAIIVFSKTYASSTWCLEELVKILNCKRTKELVVYPLFYNVDPSEVRHQRECYGQQLAMHDKQKVQNWSLALHEAANLAGWHFKEGKEYEYEFIRRIVEMVDMSKRNLIPIDKYLVGLESRVPKIIFRLQLSAPTVIMVGICGVSGIGKTTLAQALYDSICQQFEGSCFLSDVGGNSAKYGLAHLQEKILSEIAGENIKVVNENKGISILIRKLQGKRVLLILDNVDEPEQLEYLAGECNWFGLGSRIIIISRYKDVLAVHGVENIYDVPKLENHEAKQLLSSMVFKGPITDYCNSFLERAIHCSHGLPLLLKDIGSALSEKMKVIGSDLSETSLDELEITLDRYEGVCDGEVQSILRVSYDSLSECDRSIFLDIACFFVGEPLSYVEEILSACGFYPEYSISKLSERSLLSIAPGGRLIMHDHMIDMARKIVQQESPLHPGYRSRLWFPQDVLQVLNENEGTDTIEVMMLADIPQGNDVLKLSDRAFKNMKSLRILILKDDIYHGVPQHLPNSLRVLLWSGYPSGCLPPDFFKLPSECLILDKFKNMAYLIKMDFTDCEFLSEVPDISEIPHLRILYLDNCINLVKVHDSVGFLGNLEELTATGCTSLKTIPLAFKLVSLRELSFGECSRLVRFPEILCEIENLKYLNLCQTAIEELPYSIGNLRGLESLNLMVCTRLDKLPSSIFSLPRLKEIQADSCRRFDISIECEDHGQLTITVSPNNVYLYLSSCNLTTEHLVTCLSGFANVIHLDISYNNLTALPACIKECIHLKTLLLNNCKQLKDILEIPPKLQDIDALNCTSLTSQSSSVLLSQVSIFFFDFSCLNFLVLTNVIFFCCYKIFV